MGLIKFLYFPYLEYPPLKNPWYSRNSMTSQWDPGVTITIPPTDSLPWLGPVGGGLWPGSVRGGSCRGLCPAPSALCGPSPAGPEALPVWRPGSSPPSPGRTGCAPAPTHGLAALGVKDKNNTIEVHQYQYLVQSTHTSVLVKATDIKKWVVSQCYLMMTNSGTKVPLDNEIGGWYFIRLNLKCK